MCRRILALTLTLAAALGLVGEARAHRLFAACRFYPRGMVRVETWFSSEEDFPKKGQVEVFDDEGKLLVKGQLSSQGLFVFDIRETRPLKVVVEAGEGHRAEVAIRPEELRLAAPINESPPTASAGPASPTDDPPPVKHEAPFPIKDVLTGIGLLIAVAAFLLSLRNARALRDLKQPPRTPPG
jgi:nickel transport protein